MKTYQTQIENDLFPELKRVLAFLPMNGRKLRTQTGYKITIEDEPSDFELSEEFDAFINEELAQLDNGERIPHEKAIAEMQGKYPTLKFSQ